MKKNILIVFFLCLMVFVLFAQQTPFKNHDPWPYIGDAKLMQSWGEYGNGFMEKKFRLYTVTQGGHHLTFYASLVKGEKLELFVNGLATGISFTGSGIGWEKFSAPVSLLNGENLISFQKNGFMVPLAENLNLDFTGGQRNAGIQPSTSGLVRVQSPAGINRVLPNPAGDYQHDIETAFSYTTFAWVYLQQGQEYSFQTAASTVVNPVLHLFHPASIFGHSWMNDNANSGTTESLISLKAPQSGFYVVMIRGTKAIPPGTIATTDIYCNGNLIVEKAMVGGNLIRSRFTATADARNFFTCKLSDPAADTRLLLMNDIDGAVTFYNDDYVTNGGDWQWGFLSRINSVWPAGLNPFYTFVCAYSPFTEAVADTYIGNFNSMAYTFFTHFKADDCIRAGVGYPVQPNPYYYNCIAWSGGLTNAFYWPGSYFSTWTVYGNELASFDNYFGNNPARYPGAYNYTRFGAIAANSVVDLWATTNGGYGLYYTHGSVKKPGNNHPHGYDWESKPGSVERSFHPRLALQGETGANYGSPVNYYIHDGTFATGPNLSAPVTGADEAVKAGLAVYDQPQLSGSALNRLKDLISRTDANISTQFNFLYDSWKMTWISNAVQSNPAAYCMNKAYKALENWCLENKEQAIWLLCDRFNQGDLLCAEPLATVTRGRYQYLMDEVRNEYKKKLYDDAGKFRIRSDYGNGICYIEKLLAVLTESVNQHPSLIKLTVSPNPVKNIMQLRFTLSQSGMVDINISSMQTLRSSIVQQKKLLEKGIHQYTIPVKDLGSRPGDLITVQVTIDGQLHTIKLLMGQ